MEDIDNVSQPGDFTGDQLRNIVDASVETPSTQTFSVQPINVPRSSSSGVQPGVLTKERINQLLEQHNCHRKRYGLDPLKWDANLARTAQAYADKGVFAHSDKASRNGAGENLARGYPAPIDAKGWIEEERFYNCGEPIPTDPSKMAEFARYGHWTQMLWSGTERVGCGLSAQPNPRGGGDSELLVCHYSPAGNIGGVAPVSAENCKTASTSNGTGRACPYQAGYVPPPPSKTVTDTKLNMEEQRLKQKEAEAKLKREAEAKKKEAELAKKAAAAAAKAAAVKQAATTATLVAEEKEEVAEAIACRVKDCPIDKSAPEPQEGQHGLTQCEIDNIMCVHNKARAEVGVPQLVWDDTLASAAAEYASKCTYPLAHWSTTDIPRPCFEYDPVALNNNPNLKLVERKRVRGKEPTDGKQCMVMGENLYIGNGCPAAKSAVEFWYDEIACTVCGAPAGRNDCEPKSPVASHSCDNKPCTMCGHYTQMVWSSTRKVGCAKRKCGDKEYVVCEYFPGGNIAGHLPFDCTVCDGKIKEKFHSVAKCDLTVPVGEGVTLPPPRKPLDDMFPETRGPVIDDAVEGEEEKEQVPTSIPEEPSSAVVEVPPATASVTDTNVEPDQILKAREALSAAELEREIAAEELASAQTTLDDAKRQLEQVRNSILESRASLEQLKEEASNAVAARTKAIEQEQDAIARGLTGAELFRFQAQRQSAETIAERLNEQIKTLEEQLASSVSEKEISDLQALVDEFEQNVASAKEKVDVTEREYAATDEQLRKLLSGEIDRVGSPAVSSDDAGATSTGLSPFLIGLIIVGSVVLFVLFMLAAFFFTKRKDVAVVDNNINNNDINNTGNRNQNGAPLSMTVTNPANFPQGTGPIPRTDTTY